MKLLKTFANSTHLTAAIHSIGLADSAANADAIHSVGGGYIVRCYDRSKNNGLVSTTSAPSFDRACALGAAYVYGLRE